MVRKYKPICLADGERGYDGEYVEFSTPSMEESSYGEYVKLETYENETKRLTRSIARRDKLIKDLHAELDKATNIKGMC